jgi:hypothetical protein
LAALLGVATDVALGLEFVTQVVKGVRLALSVSAERCLGGCDQVVEVRERQGEPAAEIAELLAWGRDDFECVRDGADDAGRVVVGVDCLLKIGVRLVYVLGRADLPV